MTTPVLIVGGGPAGMAMARALRVHGIAFDAVERHTDLGGLWDQTNPGSPMYDSAHFISSKTQSHFAGFPMPDNYPDYPSHRQILAYLHAFADAYDLRSAIRCGVAVTSAERRDDGWHVVFSDGTSDDYAALVCATGTNWHPVMPDYPGLAGFTGDVHHANTYRNADEFRGRRVLIVGAGNSGVDIACDAAQTADVALISMRRGYHFIPKHVFGIPADEFAANGPHLPLRLEQALFGVLLRILNGNPARYGLPKPDHKLFETHPILNSQILHYLSHGDLQARPDIARIDGGTVHFRDGRRDDLDLIVCATGYRWDIPYLDARHFTWRGGRPELCLNLLSPTDPALYALGYAETNGGAYKLFDEMADVIARTIAARAAGGAAAAAVDALVRSDHADLSGGIRFVSSDRHATYLDSATYRRHLAHIRGALGWPAFDDAALTPAAAKNFCSDA